MKLICINPMLYRGIELHKIYEGSPTEDYIVEEKSLFIDGWYVELEDSKDSYIFDISIENWFPKSCFMTLSEYRDKRINEILE